jgi:DNA-binding transcriptional ArsR family regulator
MNKHGLESPYRDRHAAKGGIERERLQELVEAGLTTAQIAEALGLSKGTVRYWLKRCGLRTRNKRGRRSPEVVQTGKEAGCLTVTMDCAHHGETEFYLEGRGYYRCKRCRSEAVTRRRRKVKRILAHEAGGRCCVCGYNRCVAALEFHHLDPAAKRLGMGYGGFAHALSRLREEAKKCVLLCANCHAEVENGVITLPGTVVRVAPGRIHHDPVG